MRLFLLVGGVVMLGLFAFQFVDTTGLPALAGFTNNKQKCMTLVEKAHPSAKASELVPYKTDLNNDGLTDYIVKIKNASLCGTAGCLFELCIQKQNDTELIPFGVAANTIEPRQTLTNGMRNIIANNNDDLIFEWTGTRYEISSVIKND